MNTYPAALRIVNVKNSVGIVVDRLKIYYERVGK